MASIKLTNTKKKEMTPNEMVTNKLQDLATVNNIKQLTTEKKKKIFIVGDSMIKNITGRGISRDHNVKIRSHLGATSIDM